MRLGIKGFTILLLLLGLTACRHAPTPVAIGSSAVSFIEPPAAPPKVGSGEIKEPVSRTLYVEARPIQPLALPIYPTKALAAKAGQATVGVNVTVDTSGQVTEIRSSILTFSTPGPFAGDFRTAVETALRQWRFAPAESQEIEPILGLDQPATRVTRSEKVETTFELSFTFTASGGVQLSPTER